MTCASGFINAPQWFHRRAFYIHINCISTHLHENPFIHSKCYIIKTKSKVYINTQPCTQSW